MRKNAMGRSRMSWRGEHILIAISSRNNGTSKATSEIYRYFVAGSCAVLSSHHLEFDQFNSEHELDPGDYVGGGGNYRTVGPRFSKGESFKEFSSTIQLTTLAKLIWSHIAHMPFDQYCRDIPKKRKEFLMHGADGPMTPWWRTTFVHCSAENQSR